MPWSTPPYSAHAPKSSALSGALAGAPAAISTSSVQGAGSSSGISVSRTGGAAGSGG